MLSILKVRYYNRIRLYAIVFSEIDSKWHFVDFEKENVRWKPYDSKEEAMEAIREYLISEEPIQMESDKK